MARLMSESTGGPTSSTAASTSNVASSSSSSSSPRSSRKPSMATEETNTSSPHRSNLQRTPSAKLHSKTTSPPRKPSFRKIRPGGPKLGYRATKVATVPSNSVALLASQFNAVVVPNDAEGRKLLKRLNSQKQILQKHVSATTSEGCVRARIKKFELGGIEQETQGVRSEVSQQNNHHKLGRKIVVEGNVSNVVKNVTTESSVKHHRLGNLERKSNGNDVLNVTESSTSHHKLNSMVEKNVRDSENLEDRVGVKHQNNSQHQNGSTHQNNASSSHHQQADRPKFVIVRKNSIISKFSRKTSIKSSINPAQSTPRLPNIDSKDALHGSSVVSSGTSPTKAVRKLSNPPKLCPKPQINQRTIFLKPVLSRYPVGALLKDSVEHGEKVSRTVRENTSTTIIMKDEGDSKDESRRIVVRKGSSDSVFCSDEENGKTPEGVPKTVKKIWRRYQVTNTRSISSIARDFVNSDSSIDGSVVQTLKYVGDKEHKLEEKNGGGHQDVVMKKGEGCSSGGGMEVKRKVHSGTCNVQRRVHRENEESKVKKEEFRKYLVKSEHIVAVQNELMSTNRKPEVKEIKNSRLAANKKQDGKEMRICVDVDKECKRYGRIIVGDGKVLKSLVNDGVEEDNLVVNKENIESKSSAKPVLDQDNLAIDKENLLLKNTINNVVGDNLIVDKENLENVSDNQALSANHVEDTHSGTRKSQVVKPKLQPKPSKVPDSRRRVAVVSKVITSPAKSKPIAVFGLSVAKDQTVLESALNGGSLKGEGDIDGEVKVVEKSINGQKNLAKPNRSFLWNTLKDKESNQNLIVPKQEEEKNDSSKDLVVPKTENIIPVEPVDNKVLEEKLKPQDVLDTNTRNTLDSKVKNTSFLFRKSIKSLPADDCLDEPIYMNGQVALSTSDIESRSKSSEMCSNFNSMVSLDGGLDRAKARVDDIGSDSFATKNVSQSGRTKDLQGSQIFTSNNSDENGRNVESLHATKNDQIDECSEVYEDFGNSDSEGTIYEEVDGSPERSPGLKYIITEARSSSIVETVNQVLVVSRQGSGYEEIKRVGGKSSDASLGQEFARNIGSKTNLLNVGHNSARNVVLKSNLPNLGTNLARNVDPRGSTKDGVVPRKESPQVSQDNSGSRSTWYAINDPNPNLDTIASSADHSGSSEHYSGSKSPSYTYIDPNVGDVVARKAPDDTYASIPGEDFSENIYDVLIHSQLKMPAEGDSCHYEDIYQSELAGSSQSDSSCDQSNSLYGVVPGHQISHNSLGVYQLNEPKANTSETSDEWVDDIDTSGGDVEIYLYEKRNKPKVKTSSSWSQKVRRQWSAKQAGDSSWDGSDYETSSHQYERMLHTQQSTASINSTSSRVPHFNFDSDSSFEDDDEEEEARRKANVDVDGGVRGDSEERTGLSATEGIYGLMKQASKRMRKHWSLGKSLRMIRKMSSSAVLGGVEEQPQDTVTNGSTTSLNRRRWSSFKSRFKPQLSSSGSIFYLDKDHSETPDCIPNVYSDKPTPTTPPSVTMATGSPTTTSVTMATVNNKSTTPPAVTMATDPRRYSIASSSLRPTSPPPPPPPHSASSSLHRQSLCEEVLAKRGGLRSVARGGRREDVGGVERVSGSDRGGGGGKIERGGGGGFESVGSGGGSDRGGGGGERIEGKVSDRLGSTERKIGGSQQQDRLGVSERGVGERLSGGGGGGGGGEAVDRLGDGVDKLGGGGFQRVGSGGGSDRRRRSGGDRLGGGGGGSERGEYGNGSLVSESDENTSSWDRRMSGVDRMSDRSSSHGSDLHLRFADEPLYQFYNETVTKEELNKCYPRDESSRNSVADFDSDGYEEIGSDRLLISRPSAMDLITPKQGHHRTLWCEIPEVINSEILKTLSKDERRIQEAKFEVMTSEASYLKSLTVLEKHFANSAAFKDESVLPTEDRKSLFGHLTGVRRCSEKLLAALDRCWQESIMLAYLSEVVSQHAKQHFHVYVTYCSNQIDLNCTLRRLKDTNKRFEEELTRLESDPLCESLSLHSFLMLPMQRVTRMPLLMDAILSKLDTNHAEYQASKAALRILNEFVQKCNEATRQQERVIEMVRLSRQLEFMDDVRTLPLVSQSRWLVRSGQVVQLNSETIGQKQTFGRKLTRQGTKITLFLFNDVLLVAKKKGEESFLVLDHCPRNLIQMTAEDDVGNALKYLIKVAMLKNHEGKLVEMLVSCDSETCQQRWLQAFAPPQASEEGESIYEAWDCPQVIAIHSYQPQPLHSQPDELTLHPTDIINVTRKMADGWYYGERTRDGEKGWFPGNHVQEIISQHIRARNLQQRYRLLMMSGSILESQKGNTNHKKQK